MLCLRYGGPLRFMGSIGKFLPFHDFVSALNLLLVYKSTTSFASPLYMEINSVYGKLIDRSFVPFFFFFFFFLNFNLLFLVLL